MVTWRASISTILRGFITVSVYGTVIVVVLDMLVAGGKEEGVLTSVLESLLRA
jgi:hypothetical protein